MALDPVCNMEVDPTTAEWVSEHRGIKYYFCDEGCKASFEKAPDMWVRGPPPQMYMGGGCSCCGGH
ncbi:MAG: YHS domain-containing protein [Thermoplasmata archaeon]|nr:YHS domain-containing protein [Thermoplasmata archaeon]MCK5414758.1 YHS domain-containing protein [Thermoplasmata archaeon]